MNPAVSRRRSESAGRRALRRFLRHRAALVGLCTLGVIAFAAIVLPFLYTVDPDSTNLKMPPLANICQRRTTFHGV